MDKANPDFIAALGQAALSIWGDLPRDVQETLFETAMKGRDDQRDRVRQPRVRLQAGEDAHLAVFPARSRAA